MALLGYTGVMGSGKTYEGVSVAALGALRQGRRVVTNISGFNYEAIRDYLGEIPGIGMLASDRVVVVPSSRVTQPHFFFDPEVESDSVVAPGDLVLLDEVWNFWGTDAKLSEEHKKFFRMHRHYTESDSGTSCDLVMMIQDLMSLHRFIRGVLETTFKFTKLKTLGLHSRYRVEVYEGRRQAKATLISVTVKKYDKRIFPLYQSYEGGAGREAVVDGRANLFSNKWFLGVFIAALFGLIVSTWWFTRYVHRMRSGNSSAVKPEVAALTPAPAAGSVAATVASATSTMASDVRVVGVVQQGAGEATVVFQGADGRIVRQRMAGGIIEGWQTVAAYQGRMATFHFGAKGK
jgi:zona occludens toxin